MDAVSGMTLLSVCARIDKQTQERAIKMRDIDNAKNANKHRVEQFKITKSDLEQHWRDNIAPAKKATEAAILLERTDIYKEAKKNPKRSTLESWVREWQRLPK